MNHKNFHFTQIPDKTNDVLFPKKSKNHVFVPFVTIFGHFCSMGIFFKKSDSVTHNYIWPPKEPIRKKITDWGKYGRKDGQTDPIL